MLIRDSCGPHCRFFLQVCQSQLWSSIPLTIVHRSTTILKLMIPLVHTHTTHNFITINSFNLIKNLNWSFSLHNKIVDDGANFALGGRLDWYFNVNTFLKSVSTSKSRVTYDLDTDLNTTTHKIIGVVGSLLYLATPVSTFQNLIFHCSWKRIHINHPCPDTDSRVFYKRCSCIKSLWHTNQIHYIINTGNSYLNTLDCRCNAI